MKHTMILAIVMAAGLFGTIPSASAGSEAPRRVLVSDNEEVKDVPTSPETSPAMGEDQNGRYANTDQTTQLSTGAFMDWLTDWLQSHTD